MPAILRIFVYQTDASLRVIGSTEPYGQGAGRWGADEGLEQYAVRTLLEIYAEQPID